MTKASKDQLSGSSSSTTIEGLVQHRRVEAALNSHLLKDEIYWKQRSHALWLNHGDRNTRYLYHHASAR